MVLLRVTADPQCFAKNKLILVERSDLWKAVPLSKMLWMRYGNTCSQNLAWKRHTFDKMVQQTLAMHFKKQIIIEWEQFNNLPVLSHFLKIATIAISHCNKTHPNIFSSRFLWICDKIYAWVRLSKFQKSGQLQDPWGTENDRFLGSDTALLTKVRKYWGLR